MNTTLHNLGFPRIGEHRELKKATESYWKKKISLDELRETARKLRLDHLAKQHAAGIDILPCFDFTLYDHVLSLSLLLGVIPKRFAELKETASREDLLFTLARGIPGRGPEGHPSELTKWFNTNYHYIVPEFDHVEDFSITDERLFTEAAEALALGYQVKPVLVGPVTYLSLGKFYEGENTLERRLEKLPALLRAYEQIITRLHASGVAWLEIDEPILSGDLEPNVLAKVGESVKALRQKMRELGPVPAAASKKSNSSADSAAPQEMQLMLVTYFNSITPSRDEIFSMDANVIHLDLTKTPVEEDAAWIESFHQHGLPRGAMLSLGVINGRNVWQADLPSIHKRLIAIKEAKIPFMLAPSCSLQHVPITLRNETKLAPHIRSKLAFAEEKLAELALLRNVLDGKADAAALTAAVSPHSSSEAQSEAEARRLRVEERLETLEDEASTKRTTPVDERKQRQQTALKLPLFPTTTIGSFPQTTEIRRARRQFKKGSINESEYNNFLKETIADVIKRQEDIGLDVLVHGEAERNDMVEYFAEKIIGYAFSENGWVQSYGSRCVKPPILYGDIERREPMTLDWIRYAQTLTNKPVKGMLTGPITMLQWSFVREDQSHEKTALQIALAIQDEVQDLEAAGTSIIQIDEPALREGLPLRQAQWGNYLEWAVKAFRVSSAKVKAETQIQTHMCYSFFDDIIDSIIALDADVILIESSRSKMRLLRTLTDHHYPADIGPGIYDIHSPRVPETKELMDLLERALATIEKKYLWVSPDCGLKTRNWEEVQPALKHLVSSAKELRLQHAPA